MLIIVRDVKATSILKGIMNNSKAHLSYSMSWFKSILIQCDFITNSYVGTCLWRIMAVILFPINTFSGSFSFAKTDTIFVKSWFFKSFFFSFSFTRFYVKPFKIRQCSLSLSFTNWKGVIASALSRLWMENNIFYVNFSFIPWFN